MFPSHDKIGWALSHFHGANESIRFNGEGHIDEKGELTNAKVQVQSDVYRFDLPVPLSGRFFAQIDLKGHEGSAHIHIPQLKVGDLLFDTVEGSIEGILDPGFKGKIDLKGIYKNQTWKGSSHVEWAKGASLYFTQANLQSTEGNVNANLEIRTDHLLVGQAELTHFPLHFLEHFSIPSLSVS